MRFVAIAIALMTLATVAVTPGLRQDLAGLVVGPHDPDGQNPRQDPRQAAEWGLESIPERVLARLAIPPASESSGGGEDSQPGGEPSEETPAPSILATALSESRALAPAGGAEREAPTAQTEARNETAPTQIAALPPAVDPLHAETGEPDWLSTLSPAAPRELIGPDPQEPPEQREPGKRLPIDPEPDRAETPDEAVRREAPFPDPTAGELMTALFTVPPLVTGAGPTTGAGPEDSVAAEAAPAAPETVFTGTQLAAAPLPEAAPTPQTSGGIFVVIGSFLRAEHAEHLVRRHAAWKPVLRDAVVDGKPRHRVVVGPFASGDWRKALARIRAEAAADAWPLPAPPEPGLAVRTLELFG